MSDFILEFLKNDEAKVEEIIKKYPTSIPVDQVADLLGMSKKSVRAAIEAGNLGGVTWRTPGALNKGFNIPTSPFIRWYMQFTTR